MGWGEGKGWRGGGAGGGRGRSRDEGRGSGRVWREVGGGGGWHTICTLYFIYGSEDECIQKQISCWYLTYKSQITQIFNCIMKDWDRSPLDIYCVLLIGVAPRYWPFKFEDKMHRFSHEIDSHHDYFWNPEGL